MPLLRIQFSASSDGSSPDTLGVNPVEIDFMDSKDIEYQNIIDGGIARQESFFDNRARRLIWRNIPTNNTTFTAQLATLMTYENKIRYVNLRDLNSSIKHIVTTWRKFRVSNIEIKLASGGRLKYETVEMVLLPVN